ncbi:MAG: hypothetical protein R3D33_15715 [Hyphomicrobiaceae bacterium]
MTTITPSEGSAVILADPLAGKRRETMALAREALGRVPLQPWGEFDGPALHDILSRLDEVLAAAPSAEPVTPEAMSALVDWVKESRAALNLAREALSRIDVQPWDDLEGPALGSIIERLGDLSRLDAGVEKAMRTS